MPDQNTYLKIGLIPLFPGPFGLIRLKPCLLEYAIIDDEKNYPSIAAFFPAACGFFTGSRSDAIAPNRAAAAIFDALAGTTDRAPGAAGAKN